jgi:hypothetical protein
VAAGALRYQNVGSIESVEEADQLQAFAVSSQTCMRERKSISAWSVEVT